LRAKLARDSGVWQKKQPVWDEKHERIVASLCSQNHTSVAICTSSRFELEG